ncbi:CBS domain-containing protein [Candidatus Woesearchaeota archaeon]|nr:CBS domain-containing protein [Candidatus Woesearchaeota archaeon]
MKKSYKIFKLLGIDVELHYSWFLVFLLLAWGLSADFFPHYYPDLTSASYWTMGIISSLLLFVSVLMHEYSHSLVARKNKIMVNKITLFFFGGIAHLGGEDKLTPKKEFKIAIAGPLLSLALAAIFFIIYTYTTVVYVKAITFYLHRLNFILALFNMAPGYPLDGGRVLRSIAWGITKDIKKATRIASNGGKMVAGVLIFFGFLGMFAGRGTLWFVILGFFLYYIAGASYEQVIIQDALGKVKIKEVMVKEVRTVSPSLNLADLFQDYFLRYGTDGVMVAKDKTFLGIVTVDRMKKIPKKEWPKVKVKEIIIPASKIPAAKETDNALVVLSRMSKLSAGVMPVIKNKKLIGAVSVASLLRYVKLNLEVS